MMIQYALYQSAYLDAAKYYYKVWETPSIKEDVDGRGREVSRFWPSVRLQTLTVYSGTRAHRVLYRARTP